MTVRDAVPHPPEAQDTEEAHRLTALEGLAALSLDALSSVAYGPEAIVIVLAAAGSASGWTTRCRSRWPSWCCWPCWSSPTGRSSPRSRAAAAPTRWPGGTWAGAASLVAAASLIVDYVLNAAVGVSAGVAALTSAFPALYGGRVWLCLAVLARDHRDQPARAWPSRPGCSSCRRSCSSSAIAVVIVGGLVRSHPRSPPVGHLPLDRRGGRPAAAAQGVRLRLLGADRRGGDRERGARVQASRGRAGPSTPR